MTRRSADELLLAHQNVAVVLICTLMAVRCGLDSSLGASPDDHVIACRITGGDPEEIDAGNSTDQFDQSGVDPASS